MAVNVFVSYSQKDRLAATLVGTLRANREVNIFIAHQFPAPGMSIRDKVRHGLTHCDVFLLLWSPQAAASDWVDFEIETARKLGKRILPMLLADEPELPPALQDIEAVPLYKNPEAGMQWLAQHLAQTAMPWWQCTLAGGNLSLGKLLVAGAALGIGLLATSGDEPKPAKRAPADSPARPGRGRRSAQVAP
jgi:TIR domain